MLRLKSALRKTASDAMINMMPMIDMVFLLLIFFLLTSIVVTQPVLDLSLPRASHSEAMEGEKSIQLVIRKGGQIEIDHETVRLEALEGILKAKIPGVTKRKLLITADREAPFGIFVQVLDRVQGLGLKDLGILTEPPEERP